MTEMATFRVTSTTTVGELKEQFDNEVGGVLRIYNGRSEAPDGRPWCRSERKRTKWNAEPAEQSVSLRKRSKPYST